MHWELLTPSPVCGRYFYFCQSNSASPLQLLFKMLGLLVVSAAIIHQGLLELQALQMWVISFHRFSCLSKRGPMLIFSCINPISISPNPIARPVKGSLTAHLCNGLEDTLSRCIVSGEADMDLLYQSQANTLQIMMLHGRT